MAMPMQNPFKTSLLLMVLSLPIETMASEHQTFGHAEESNILFTSKPVLNSKASPPLPGDSSFRKLHPDDRAIKEIRLVDVKFDQVTAKTKSLSIPLPTGHTVHFDLLRTSEVGFDMLGWVGRASSTAPAGPFDWVSLVRYDNGLVGNINVDGQFYRIEPVGAGEHALLTLDPARLPPLAEPVLDHPDAVELLQDAASAESTSSNIRVLFVTTNQSRAAHPAHRAKLALALQDANQYMINSLVPINFELAGYYDAPYDEADKTYSQQLADMKATEPLGKLIDPHREVHRADLVSMLSTVSSVCGVANLNAQKTRAFSVVSCFGALGHELGHNLGAMHKWPEEESWNVPPYAFGYRHEAPKFHTQMVTSHGAIPYFSNPRVINEGVPVGDPLHGDTARRFNERRTVIENFYP